MWCVTMWASRLRGKRVLLRLDNSTAVACINRAHSGARSLAHLIDELHEVAKKIDFEVVAVHVPGEENVEADSLSRLLTAR